MKTYLLFILSAITLFGCSTQNPSPNTNNSNNYSYTQGANLIDADGNVYPTFITSCGQTWMQKNLDVSHYRNGDVIPQANDSTTWVNFNRTQTGAWCYFRYSSTFGSIYGKLYNGYAISDTRGLAPQGWHIPSNSDWWSFITCIGGLNNGGAMKETGFLHWLSPNEGATNSSGFTALPGGSGSGSGSINHFSYIGVAGNWWGYNPLVNNNDSLEYWMVDYVRSSIDGGSGLSSSNCKSIRCIKD